jgi:ferric-dicitrate binding protein FerR (iron transport regulator)
MNITKEIITDLFPLYVGNACSADTRALVEEYLRQHPREAEELRRTMDAPVPGLRPTPKQLDEMESLRRAKQLVRRRGWLMGLAIFFSLAPFSLIHTQERTYWLFMEAPWSALVYGAVAVGLWVAYAEMRRRSRTL